jgi:hypothetical protein
MWARNIDSRSRTAKQLRFKSALVPIRLFQNPIPQLLYGDFCNTICQKQTLAQSFDHLVGAEQKLLRNRQLVNVAAIYPAARLALVEMLGSSP